MNHAAAHHRRTEMVNAVRKGATVSATARQFGVSSGLVSIYCHDAGLAPRRGRHAGDNRAASVPGDPYIGGHEMGRMGMDRTPPGSCRSEEARDLWLAGYDDGAKDSGPASASRALAGAAL